MVRRFFTLAATSVLLACAPHERLAELSAPEVSCEQRDIQIAGVLANKGGARYTATCPDGKSYRCISLGRPYGDEPETTCSLASDDAADGGESTSSTSSGTRGRAAPRGVLPGGWPRVRVEACGAELTLPASVTRTERTEPTTGARMYIAQAFAGKSEFGFSCAKLEGSTSDRATAEKVLAGSVRGAIEAVDGELIQSRKLPQLIGRTLVLRIKGRQTVMRIWLERDWVYMGMVAGIELLPEGAVAEYLERIQVDSPAP